MDHNKPSLYDVDFFRWTTEQADLLRRGCFAEADLANIVEEIEMVQEVPMLTIEGERNQD